MDIPSKVGGRRFPYFWYVSAVGPPIQSQFSQCLPPHLHTGFQLSLNLGGLLCRTVRLQLFIVGGVVGRSVVVGKEVGWGKCHYASRQPANSRESKPQGYPRLSPLLQLGDWSEMDQTNLCIYEARAPSPPNLTCEFCAIS